MRRHLNGHVVDVPRTRLGVHPRRAGHPVRQVHREVMPLSGQTRPPRDGRVVSGQPRRQHQHRQHCRNLYIYIGTRIYISIDSYVYVLNGTLSRGERPDFGRESNLIIKPSG